MIAESWEELKSDKLRKSWRKLWPQVMSQSDQIKDKHNNDMQGIVNDLQANIFASEVEE